MKKVPSSFSDQFNELERLIREASAFAGGDTEEFLKEYIKDTVMRYRDNLDVPIQTFEDLARQGCLYAKGKFKYKTD